MQRSKPTKYSGGIAAVEQEVVAPRVNSGITLVRRNSLLLWISAAPGHRCGVALPPVEEEAESVTLRSVRGSPPTSSQRSGSGRVNQTEIDGEW